MIDEIDLSSIVCSRICHDLVSPIGAISNGVELLMIDHGAEHGVEIALLCDSVASANARIRFFRMAFGTPGSSDQTVPREELISIIDDLKRGGRLLITWIVPSAIPRPEAKLIFLAFACLESSMPHGGEISISQHGYNWHVHGMADRLRLQHDLWQIPCTGHSPPGLIEPANVHFAIFQQALSRQHRTLDLKISEEQILARF